MRITEYRHPLVNVLYMAGKLDIQCARPLREVFQEKIRSQCAVLIMDLTGVRFIDSIGVALLVEYFRDAVAFDGRLCLAGPTQAVRAVLDVVRLDETVPIFRSTEEAIKALPSASISSGPDRLVGWGKEQSRFAA